MQMSLPFLELKTLLDLIHTGVKMKIMDIDSNDMIEDTTCYDGFNHYGNFKVEGVTSTSDGYILITVKPL